MNTHDTSKESEKTTENPSFDSDGPWANAWCVDPETFTEDGNQVRMDPKKSDRSKRFSKRGSTFS